MMAVVLRENDSDLERWPVPIVPSATATRSSGHQVIRSIQPVPYP